MMKARPVTIKLTVPLLVVPRPLGASTRALHGDGWRSGFLRYNDAPRPPPSSEGTWSSRTYDQNKRLWRDPPPPPFFLLQVGRSITLYTS